MSTKGEQTRQRILEKAAEIFNTKGYAGSSIEDILEATGLEKGGLYRHFACKEVLAKEAFHYAWQQTRHARGLDQELTGSPLQRLRETISTFAERRSPIPGGCPLMNTAVENDDGNPALRAMAMEAFEDWHSRLKDLVQAAINQGELRWGTSCQVLANQIIASLEGGLMLARLEGNPAPLLHVKQMLDAHLEELAVWRENSTP